MDRRRCLSLLAAAPSAMAAGLARAQTLSEADFTQAIIIDGCSGFDDPYAPTGARRISAQAIAEIHQSGETACAFTVNAPGNNPDVWDKTVELTAGLDQYVADNPDILVKVTSAVGIRRAKADKKLAVIYQVQDSSMVGPDLNRYATLKGLGVQVAQVTYNIRNLSGDGCLEPGNAGLSKLGRATIARIEQEKILLDLSHSGQRTVAESIAAATRPMTISHTGCRAINNNPRNVADTELKACADKGGVVGIFWTPFLAANSHATSADLLAHMNHALKVCGEDHVSIGTDGFVFKTRIDAETLAAKKKRFEERSAAGMAAPGEGPDVFNIVWDWDNRMRFRLLSEGLTKSGWTARQIEKVLGANLMRLYEETWGE